MFRIFSSAEPGPQLTWTAMVRNALSRYIELEGVILDLNAQA